MTGSPEGEAEAQSPFNGRAAVTRLVRPFQKFVQTEAASGVFLLAAAVIAIIWANSPWESSYLDLWHTELAIDLHLFSIEEDLGHWVNDGLMAFFFFVVGLEIKRELLHGELASVRRATLPVAAALGGMIAPALIYTAFNAGDAGSKGWGIPMATDIAFSVGVLTLLGRRAPFALKVFLLALAIVDDLGAILVIAVFYTEEIAIEPVLWGLLLIASILVVQRAGVRTTQIYVVLGALFWVAVLKSGIHATIAGVVLAMLTPASPFRKPESFEPAVQDLLARLRFARDRHDEEGESVVLGGVEKLVRDTESPLERLEHQLLPWTSFVIMPIFALANAGVTVSSESLGDALGSPVTLGVALGLLLGKPIGILTFSYLAVRLGLAALPGSVRSLHIVGVGILAGIGFTVSLFITGLAFEQEALVPEAKSGILGASLVAGTIAFIYLWLAPGESPDEAAARERELALGPGGAGGR